MCTRHCQVRVVNVFRVEKANPKPQWHCGSEAGCWGEPFSRELKSRGSLFVFSFECLTVPWFEPFQAAREGLCSFTPAHGDMKEVACATLRGHSGTAGAGHAASRRSSKGRADSTSSPLTSLFCPAPALTPTQPLEQKYNPKREQKLPLLLCKDIYWEGGSCTNRWKWSCCCSEALI